MIPDHPNRFPVHRQPAIFSRDLIAIKVRGRLAFSRDILELEKSHPNILCRAMDGKQKIFSSMESSPSLAVLPSGPGAGEHFGGRKCIQEPGRRDGLERIPDIE